MISLVHLLTVDSKFTMTVSELELLGMEKTEPGLRHGLQPFERSFKNLSHTHHYLEYDHIAFDECPFHLLVV